MELDGNLGKHGLEGDALVQFLTKGGELTAVKSNKWKKKSFYRLMDDGRTIRQESFIRDNTFSIDDIESIRTGRQTEGLQKYTDATLEEHCFSIIFKGKHKNLDLVASSKADAKRWVMGLQKVITNLENLSSQQKSEQWIISCMKRADKNGDSMMTLKEVMSFLHRINIQMDDTHVAKLFDECDTSKSGTLEGAEIKTFIDLITQRPEINAIYEKYAVTGGQMSAGDLQNFLQEEQKETVSVEYAQKLIDKYEPDFTGQQNERMTKDGFLMYLNATEALIFNPAHMNIYQDMTQPLNHYFISSSHNTYLMEDQLKGPSSTEAYIKALLKSCRCVELDCWDGPDGEPIIYHGHTLTSKVLFEDVIKTIMENAFKTSEYPVILSLETHCSVPQQKRMVEHLTEILDDALLKRPLGTEVPTLLPSPEELKRKILIKGKRLNKLEAAFNNNNNNNNNNNTEDVDSMSEEDEAAEAKPEGEHGAKPKDPKKKEINLAKELSDLVIYCKSVHFTSFEHSHERQACYEMCSFKESKAKHLAETSATGFIHHNMEKLSRIYPMGSRTDSSNYNPVTMWNAGCQIVALNFQTAGEEMDLNQGRFLPNGKTGYILKPEFLRNPDSQFDPNNCSKGLWFKKKILQVMVISAQQLPKLKSIVDPYVRVEIFGVPADQASTHTTYISNNGFNPLWNQNFEFTVRVPDLALVRFLVMDHDTVLHKDFIGQYTLPFTSMQNGYRHIPLLTKSGDIMPSAKLFVHIMVTDP